jgi:hypothetical protein
MYGTSVELTRARAFFWAVLCFLGTALFLPAAPCFRQTIAVSVQA